MNSLELNYSNLILIKYFIQHFNERKIEKLELIFIYSKLLHFDRQNMKQMSYHQLMLIIF